MNLIETFAFALILSLSCAFTRATVSLALKEARQHGGERLLRSNTYVRNNQLLDWAEARKACMSKHATLAYPNSPYEADHLRGFMYYGNTTMDLHVGFHSAFVRGVYVTVDGRPLEQEGFNQWDPKSENASHQRCGAMSLPGLKTIDCSTLLDAVCEYTEDPVYEEIGDFGAYTLHNYSLSWTDAIAKCHVEGGYLLILRSAGEYDAVHAHFSERGAIHGTLDLLYGAHQLFAEHVFVTLADELVSESGYDVWAPDEPGSEPLVGVRMADVTTPDEHDAGLFAAPRDLPMPYIVHLQA